MQDSSDDVFFGTLLEKVREGTILGAAVSKADGGLADQEVRGVILRFWPIVKNPSAYRQLP